MSELNREYWTGVGGEFTHVQKFDDAVASIKAHIETVEMRNKYLEEENKKLKDAHYKDEVIAKMKAERDEAIEDIRRGFEITKSESEAIRAWKDKHYEEIHGANTLAKKMKMGGAIGGTYEYEFTPTSIGTFGTCICGACRIKAFKEARGDRKKYQELLEKYDATFNFSEP